MGARTRRRRPAGGAPADGAISAGTPGGAISAGTPGGAISAGTVGGATAAALAAHVVRRHGSPAYGVDPYTGVPDDAADAVVVRRTASDRLVGFAAGAIAARAALGIARAVATSAPVGLTSAPPRTPDSTSAAGSAPATVASTPAPDTGTSRGPGERPDHAAGTTVPPPAEHQGSEPVVEPTGRWDRTNYRGVTVSLLAGPAYTAGAAAALALSPGLAPRVRAAAVVATVAAGGLGLLDDLAGSGADRGLRGHWRALRRGDVTTGAVKVGGLAVTGVVAARLVGHRGADALASGAVVAGAANLVNLLDLRPGRALKVGLAHTTALVAFPAPGFTLLAAPLGAAAGLLPDDLREHTMLGDAGANALGAAIGVAAIASYGRVGRLAHLVGIAALTLASERVSFSTVIDTTPPLRWLDGLGRRR